jgi:transposase
VSEASANSGRVRRNYTQAEKLRMVEATLEPGASVARVAQANGINANVLFVWRKQYREGHLTAGGIREPRLLPVAVTEMPISTIRTTQGTAQANILHLDLPRRQVRIEGSVDTAMLRVVLEMLLR